MCRRLKIQNLLTASTSSVYGLNEKFPLKESNAADHPIQFYAATKKSNEIMAHSYSYLFKIPITCLRFFTVYGPWGRPDMALFKFTKSILKKKKLIFLTMAIMQETLLMLMMLFMQFLN